MMEDLNYDSYEYTFWSLLSSVKELLHLIK